MERRKEENISDILCRFLRQSQLETPLNEYRLIQAWDEVCGIKIARYTKDLKIYNQKLFVRLSSSSIRTELLMNRTELIKRLNEKVGSTVINDIGFM